MGNRNSCLSCSDRGHRTASPDPQSRRPRLLQPDQGAPKTALRQRRLQLAHERRITTSPSFVCDPNSPAQLIPIPVFPHHQYEDSSIVPFHWLSLPSPGSSTRLFSLPYIYNENDVEMKTTLVTSEASHVAFNMLVADIRCNLKGLFPDVQSEPEANYTYGIVPSSTETKKANDRYLKNLSNKTSRRELVEFAKLAEKMERYDEMLYLMALVVLFLKNENPRSTLTDRTEGVEGDDEKEDGKRTQHDQDLICAIGEGISVAGGVPTGRHDSIVFSLLRVAHKNAVGSRKASWRIISAVGVKELEKGNDEAFRKTTVAGKRVAREMQRRNAQMALLLETLLETLNLPLHDGRKDIVASSQPMEHIRTHLAILCYEVLGDCHRFACEYYPTDFDLAKDAAHIAHMNNSAAAVKAAHLYLAELRYAQAAQWGAELPNWHYLKVGTLLNYSVFVYEAKGEHAQALKIARETFARGVRDLHLLTEARYGQETDELYRHGTLLLQLVKDNLTLWDGASE